MPDGRSESLYLLLQRASVGQTHQLVGLYNRSFHRRGVIYADLFLDARERRREGR